MYKLVRICCFFSLKGDAEEQRNPIPTDCSEKQRQDFQNLLRYLYDKEEVEDLYQEILINIWQNLGSFRGRLQ